MIVHASSNARQPRVPHCITRFRSLFAVMTTCVLLVECDDPVGGDRIPNLATDRACALTSPGVQAEFSGSGTNATLGPFSGDIQRISAPTATPNYLSTSLTTTGRKFVMIVGGDFSTYKHPVGEGGTYLSYNENAGTANAKVWVAQEGEFSLVLCDGGGRALWGHTASLGPIAMKPAAQSTATGTLYVEIYAKRP